MWTDEDEAKRVKLMKNLIFEIFQGNTNGLLPLRER